MKLKFMKWLVSEWESHPNCPVRIMVHNWVQNGGESSIGATSLLDEIGKHVEAVGDGWYKITWSAACAIASILLLLVDNGLWYATMFGFCAVWLLVMAVYNVRGLDYNSPPRKIMSNETIELVKALKFASSSGPFRTLGLEGFARCKDVESLQRISELELLMWAEKIKLTEPGYGEMSRGDVEERKAYGGELRRQVRLLNVEYSPSLYFGNEGLFRRHS